MNTDDRDIVCEQDYTPLSNAELVAAIERYAAIMHTAPLIDFDLERITGPARALLARAEAAEALAYERLEAALFAEQRATDAEAERDGLRDECSRAEMAAIYFEARVAELEARAQRHAQDYDALHQDYEKMRRNWEGTADIGAALATAEAREQASMAVINDLRDKLADSERTKAALAARVAELEAQLDAQGWRPVTEEPPAHDSYLVYRAVPPRGEPWNYEFGIWDDTGWDVSAVTHWRPLPPAPQEPTR